MSAKKNQSKTWQNELSTKRNEPPFWLFAAFHKKTLSVLYLSSYRTEAPDLLVKSLAAMFIDCSSWKSNLAAYGMWICAILVLFLQGRHSKDCLERFLLSMLVYELTVQYVQDLRNWCHKTADLTNMNSESVRDFKQTLLQEGCCTMGNHTITLHFTET